MSGFSFRFEALLRVRREAERRRTRVVGELGREIEAILAQVRRHRSAIEAAEERQRARLDGRVDVDAAREAATEAAHHRRRAEQLVRTLAPVHERLAQARAALQAAARDRRVIERLREQRLAAWRRDQIRREQGALDDVVAARVAREVQS